jgi:subtilisin family serine protease
VVVSRAFLLAFLLNVSSATAADVGELLWEPGMKAMDGRKLAFPGAPKHGRAAQNAQRVAVIDSGIAPGHPQLDGYVVDAVDFTGEGLEDALGHGTAVALVAAFGERLPQPEVALLSAKVADRNGRVREGDVIRAIEWAAARGARVVYLRLGFRGSRREHAALCEAIRERWNVLFFASAVNIVPPVEVYPANCRLGNLHATWADPRARPPLELAPNEVLGPGMAKLILE